MKLVRSNGRTMTVRDVGAVLLELRATPGHPLPICDDVLTDDNARELCRRLLGYGFYEKVEPKGDDNHGR